MANMIVKITDGKDIRRFTTSTANLSYSTIHKHAAEAFNMNTKDFKLKYKDDEGDQITMSTDAEIAEAVGLTLKLEPPVLRLTLVPNSRPASPVRAAAAADGPPELAELFKNIKAKLPEMLEQMPEALKGFLPQAELDIAASIAATAADAGYGTPNPAADPNMEGAPRRPPPAPAAVRTRSARFSRKSAHPLRRRGARAVSQASTPASRATSPT